LSLRAIKRKHRSNRSTMNFVDLQGQYEQLKEDVDRRIQKVLSHGQYICGPEVAELEKVLEDYTGASHCIGVSSGTDALLIALMSAGVGVNDEVITSPFTFFATAEVISRLGAVPVFVDIDEHTYNINPSLIEKAITKRTKVVMPVSLYGQCADMDKINEVASRHGLIVIEDGAQSFGAMYKGSKSCSLSTIGCTSFFPSKPLGCYGDGGACFTNDADIANRLREISAHGQESRYNHTRLGLTGRLDTIQAAVLLSKMTTFPDEVASRARVGKSYSQKFNSSCAEKLVTPYVQDHNDSVFAQYTIQVDRRDRLQAYLSSVNIPSAVHYPVAVNRQPVFAGQDWAQQKFEVADYVAARVLSLPMHPYLSESDQVSVVSAVTAFLAD
jgi:UDP-2-acetamido-2-deoxy-ribo-hexuluronate aminotransferase